MTTYTDVDKLLLSRWSDVRAMFEAFEQLHDRMYQHLQEVVSVLRPWAGEQGFELKGERRWAEFRLHRDSWANKDGDWGVTLVFGGVFPNGYRSINCRAPYAFLYAHGLPESARETFAREFKLSLGQVAQSWNDPECNDKQPAGRYLTAYTDAERTSWMTDGEALRDAAKKELATLFPLAELAEQVLQRLRASKSI